MGTLIKQGTASRMPELDCNSRGSPKWSGKELADFTEFDGWCIRRFTEAEAYLQGWNDGRNAHASSFNPFHPEFLFGEPNKTWREFYLFGFSDGLKGASFNIPQSVAVCEVEYAMWPHVVQVLKECAQDFDISYRKLGVEKRSAFWGIRAALVGWFSGHEGEFSPILEDEEFHPV